MACGRHPTMKNSVRLFSTVSGKGITMTAAWETNRRAVARAGRNLVPNVPLSLSSHVISGKSQKLPTVEISHGHHWTG